MSMKKKLSKEELRKAMLEAKRKHSTIKKIESPLARYNELDQLTCVLCKMVVRSEAVWPVHLNSKVHKDNIMLAKKTKLESIVPSQVAPSLKRPSTFQEPQEPKKVKGILKNAVQPPPNVKAGLPDDFFENTIAKQKNVIVPKLNVTNCTNDNVNINEKEKKLVEKQERTIETELSQTVLPEGFFDDPIKDAKARNVEYKDPIEEEWERFQKEIKEETAQSAQIIGDDQEEAATERQLDVIEEQLRNLSRVMDLVKQKELVKAAEKKQDNNDSSSDEDVDEFLDWRAKKSYRD